MKIRTGHKPTDWSENIEGAYARIPGIKGSVITGGHGPAENARRATNASRARKAAAKLEPKASA